MKRFLKSIGMLLFLCISNASYAQYDDYDTVEEWTLEDVEEETQKPQHKEYKNFLYLQYSPSRYHTGDDKLYFHEFSAGYARSIQIVEENPYFIEVGASMKYSHAKESGTCYNLLTFKVPVNVVYKFYLSKTKDIALAPYAGVHVRAIAAGKEDGWKAFQIGWQVGVKYYWNRLFMGISYARDFPDETKDPHVHECSVHLGFCF